MDTIGGLNTNLQKMAPAKMKASNGVESESIKYQRTYKPAGATVSLEEVQEQKKTTHEKCFLCGRSGMHGDESTAIGRLYRMFRTEYANHNSTELFDSLEQFYKIEIWQLYSEQVSMINSFSINSL